MNSRPPRPAAVRVLPTALTLGEPSSREVGTLLTMMWRADGVGAAFGSSEDDARALAEDAEVDAVVLKVTDDLLAADPLPIAAAHVVVVTATPAGGWSTLARATALLAPQGRLVLNADDPELVRFGSSHTVPVAWYSTRPDCPDVMRGVGDTGDGAIVHDGHLMVAHRGGWCDAGEVRRLPRHLEPGTALAAAVAALCAGVSLRTVVAALPA